MEKNKNKQSIIQKEAPLETVTRKIKEHVMKPYVPSNSIKDCRLSRKSGTITNIKK